MLLDFDLKPGDRQNEGLSELQSDRTGRAAEAGARGAGGRVLAVADAVLPLTALPPHTPGSRHKAKRIPPPGARRRGRGGGPARDSRVCAHSL